MRFTLNLTWWRGWYDAGQTQDADSVLDDHPIPVKDFQRKYTLTLIDFDDTLFPTTALRHAGVDAYEDTLATVDADTASALRRCEREALALVRAARAAGAVAIVTVASERWVKDALAAFMPSLGALVTGGTLRLQSARDDYARHEADAPHTWKYWAFRHQLKPYEDRASDVDVIVVGDGYPERYAARHVGELLGSAAAVKMVEILPASSMGRLAAQLAFTTAAYDGLNVNFDSCQLEYIFD